MVDVVTLAVIRQVKFDDGRTGFELQRYMVGQNLNIAEYLTAIGSIAEILRPAL
jgi:hypothetical protein